MEKALEGGALRLRGKAEPWASSSIDAGFPFAANGMDVCAAVLREAFALFQQKFRNVHGVTDSDLVKVFAEVSPAHPE